MSARSKDGHASAGMTPEVQFQQCCNAGDGDANELGGKSGEKEFHRLIWRVLLNFTGPRADKRRALVRQSSIEDSGEY
jgi:hypothetical protein